MFWERGTNSCEMNCADHDAAGVPGVGQEVRPCDFSHHGEAEETHGFGTGVPADFSLDLFIMHVGVTEFTGRSIKLPHRSSASSPLDADLPRMQSANGQAAWRVWRQ